jgi:hypothetical protein
MEDSAEKLTSLFGVEERFRSRSRNHLTKDLHPVRAVSGDLTSSAGFLWAGDARPSRIKDASELGSWECPTRGPPIRAAEGGRTVPLRRCQGDGREDLPPVCAVSGDYTSSAGFLGQGMRDPAGEKIPLDLAYVRVRHVARPSEQANVVEMFRCGDAEALVDQLVTHRECDVEPFGF